MKLSELNQRIISLIADPKSKVTWDSDIAFHHMEAEFILLPTGIGVATHPDGLEEIYIELDYPTEVFKEEIAAAKGASS